MLDYCNAFIIYRASAEIRKEREGGGREVVYVSKASKDWFGRGRVGVSIYGGTARNL